MPRSARPSPRDMPTALRDARRECRPVLARIGLFSFFVNLLMLTGPLYMMQVFDRVLGSGRTETLIVLTVIAAVALLVMGLLEAVRGQILGRMGRWIERRLGPELLGSTVRGSLLGLAPSTQPLRDLGTLRGFLAGPSVTALLDLPWVPVFLIVIAILHPILGIIGAVAAVALFAVAVTAEVAARRPLHDAGQHSVAAGQTAEATLRNAEVVQAMGMLPALLGRWTATSEEARDRQVLAADRSALLTGLSRFLRAVAQVLVLGAGAWLVLRGALTPGGMIAGSILLGRALAPVDQAIGAWRGFVSAREAFHRLRDTLATLPAPEPGMPLPAPEGRLSCEKVVYVTANRDAAVLKGIDFTVEPGTVLGVVGPSAAGKSTLCRILVGAVRPSRGHARLDGADVFAWDAAERGRYVGYLPQDVELFPGTVKDNIARFQAEPDPETVVSAAKGAGVHEMILALPQGYETDIGDGGRILSGGQRQRLGLARALYGRPRLIVLDEPTSNLDGDGEQALLSAVTEARDVWGATVVLVAHGLRVLRVADQLMVLRDGQVDRLGPRDEVLEALRPKTANTGAPVPQPGRPYAMVPGGVTATPSDR